MSDGAPLVVDRVDEVFPNPDDLVLDPGTVPDHWTETYWFALHDLGSPLSIYVHAFVRPALGLTGGGVVAWSGMLTSPLDATFSNYQHALPMDGTLLKGGSSGGYEFPTGLDLRVEEPGTRYALEYAYKDVVRASITFDGACPATVDPRSVGAFTQAGHLDQLGTFEGSLTLRQTERHLSGVAVRDRSRGPRPDYFGDSRGLGSLQGYAVGLTPSGDSGFLAVSAGTDVPSQDLVGGFWWTGGEVREIREGTRRIERQDGRPTRVVLEGTCGSGERFTLRGTPRNQLPLHLFPPTVTWVTRMDWADGAADAYVGEDQDVWSFDLWQSHGR